MTILHFIFLFSLTVRLGFAFYFYLKLALYRDPLHQPNDLGVGISTIVCYYNESENVQTSLKGLSNQTYKDIEFILVDDMSSDDTYTRLQKWSPKNSVVIKNNKVHNGKKVALTNGIHTATKDWLLLTDADCITPPNWASKMANYTKNNKIVLGYAPLLKSKKLIGKFARYETYYTALQYLSFALAGRPYMGVGRNLMYHKSIFDNAGGFDSHSDIASGDDDLLINYAANSSNTAICLDSDTFVYSPGKETIRSFIRQKSRHISSSHRYKCLDKFLLGLSSIAHIGLYISALILLFSQFYDSLVLIPSYWLVMLIIQYPISKKLHSMDMWLLYPVYDIAMAIYYIMMIPFTFFKKQNTWS